MAARKRRSGKKKKYHQSAWEKKHNKAPIELLVRRYEKLGRTIAEHGKHNFPK